MTESIEPSDQEPSVHLEIEHRSLGARALSVLLHPGAALARRAGRRVAERITEEPDEVHLPPIYSPLSQREALMETVNKTHPDALLVTVYSHGVPVDMVSKPDVITKKLFNRDK